MRFKNPALNDAEQGRPILPPMRCFEVEWYHPATGELFTEKIVSHMVGIPTDSVLVFQDYMRMGNEVVSQTRRCIRNWTNLTELPVTVQETEEVM